MVATTTSANLDLKRVLQHVLHDWPSTRQVSIQICGPFEMQAELLVAGLGRRLNRGSRVINLTTLR